MKFAEAGELQSPVDASLTMPESLPPPPSSSTASPLSTPSSAFSASLLAHSHVTQPPMATTESVEAPDTPTVVDLASESRELEDEDEEEEAAAAAGEAPQSSSGDNGLAQPSSSSDATTAVDGAAAAAEADTPSAESMEESLRLSEERAAAALHRFSTTLHAELVEQLIDDAAVAVEETLYSTIRQHSTRVRALVAHNEALDTQLAQQASQMRHMQTEWETSIVRDVQRVLRVDLRAALRAQGSAIVSPSLLDAGQNAGSRKDEGACDEQTSGEQQGSQTSASHAHENEEAGVLEASQTQQRGSGTNQRSSSSSSSHSNAELIKENVSVDELVATYLGTRGTIEVLQRERDEWRTTVSSLQASLLAATQENAALRHELAHLRSTTVDFETHRLAEEARAEAEHQCELLRLQLARQAEEAETLAALVERQELLNTQSPLAAGASSTSPEAATTTTAVATGAQAHANATADTDGVRKGPVWDVALDELENQAIVAANFNHVREQLAHATAELKKLEAERDASVAYAAALKAEGDVLRSDAQSLVYRNGVLSQQVASLLVKVENTTRAYRHLQASTAHTQPPQRTSWGTKSRDEAGADRTLVPSSLLKSLPTTPSRRSNWLASLWPSASASRGALASADTTAVRPPSSHAAATGRPLNTAILYGRPSSSDVQQLLYMPDASADVSYLQGPTEVEEGVQQRLNTYSNSHVSVPATLLAAAADSSAHHQHLRRSRQISLRQLGSATLSVDLACTPRLPASDQLSGVALSRPSTYSTLDPLHGRVTRRVGGAQISVPYDAQGRTSVSSSSIIASVEDVNEDEQLLCMLDTLDKDESLDRFSVNSVSELVVRNQELVKQLYETTQRAEVAERQQQQLQAEADEKEKARSTIQASGNAPLPASLTSPTAALLRHAETAAGLSRRSAGGTPSRKRDRGDNGDGDVAQTTGAAFQSQGRGSAGLVQSEQAANTDSSPSLEVSEEEAEVDAENKSDNAAAAAAVEPWFLQSASAAVSSMVDALVRRHEVRLTAVDTDVSRALLRALAAQREADNAVPPQSLSPSSNTSSNAAAVNPSTPVGSCEGGQAGSAPSRAMAVCLRSLLQLCVRQSATLAEVALNAADQQQQMQAAVKKTWTEVQETLVRALQTSQAALSITQRSCNSSSTETLVSSSVHALPARKRTRTQTAASASATAAVDTNVTEASLLQQQQQQHGDFQVTEQVTLLQELTSLLQTAAKKDGTLLHVYQAAQTRQEARQHQQKERITRLLLKLERKRRLIQALRLRQAHVGSATSNVGLDAAAVRGVSYAAQDTEAVMNTQGSAATAANTFRLSPQPSSPMQRTPPLPPMSLPSATVLGSPQPRQRPPRSSHARTDIDDPLDERTVHVSSQPSERSDGASDEEDDVDDEAMTLDIFRELQQQLAVSQATYRAVQAELDEEKRKHTTLLERMWVLETARDEAEAVKETLERRVSNMVSRDAFQTIADNLAKVKEELRSRDAQLSSAVDEHHALQEKMAALTAQLEAEQLQAKARSGQLQEVARQHEQRLAFEENRCRELSAQLLDVKQHAAGLENAIALVRRELQDKAQVIRQREGTIEELKSQTLMRDDVQGLLSRLYPGDSALQANTQLVQHLSHTTAKLQLQLAEVKQDLAHTQEALRQCELNVLEAVQDRQAAEVRLQDAVARLAELQVVDVSPAVSSKDDDGDEEAAQRGGGSGSNAPGNPNATAHSTTRRDMEALFNVEEASTVALRQRVRYLTTCMEAQTADLAVLREAEAAWKSREEDLRRQLEVMSADPISLTARKYGLTACVDFAGQMAEMQVRQEAQRTALEAAEAGKAQLEEKIKASTKKEAETENQRAEAVAQVHQLEEQLAAVQAESRHRDAAIAQLESQQQAAAATHAELMQEHQRTLSDLHDKTAALNEAQATLDTCRTQRDQFLADNKQMISAVEKLEKALLQSEAEKVAAREALAQGLSSSSSRRHRGNAVAGRYQSQASLTQDLSFSSTAPRP